MWTWWFELYENLQIFVDLTQFQKFLALPPVSKFLCGLPKRLKTLELRSGDTHKNSNVPQMLLAFEETV